jgi:hypothetical protein
MPPKPKPEPKESQEAARARRASSRGYTLEQDDDGQWYAAIGGTRWGPMTVEELDEFLPAE